MYAYLTKSSEKREGGITYQQISLVRGLAPIMPTCTDCRTEPAKCLQRTTSQGCSSFQKGCQHRKLNRGPGVWTLSSKRWMSEDEASPATSIRRQRERTETDIERTLLNF